MDVTILSATPLSKYLGTGDYNYQDKTLTLRADVTDRHFSWVGSDIKLVNGSTTEAYKKVLAKDGAVLSLD